MTHAESIQEQLDKTKEDLRQAREIIAAWDPLIDKLEKERDEAIWDLARNMDSIIDSMQKVTECSTGHTFWEIWKSNDCPSCAMAQRDELLKTLRDLVTQVDKVHKSEDYYAVWAMAQAHRGPYAGPVFTDELNRARSLLEKYRGKDDHEVPQEASGH